MATVYFTSYTGDGFRSSADIHPDIRRDVTRRCEALALTVPRWGRPVTGMYKGAHEPSFMVHAYPVDAVKLAKAAVLLFNQESALVFDADNEGPYVRLTVDTYRTSWLLKALNADGCTFLPDNLAEIIVPRETFEAHRLALLDAVLQVERGTATFVTA